MRSITLFLAAALAAAAAPVVRDIDGKLLNPFNPGGAAVAVFFISTDCPISNSYAPEIRGICRDYRSRGIFCLLVYEDLTIDSAVVRRHLAEYAYSGIPAAIDAQRYIATRAGATVTPQAVLIGRDGRLRYSGRIDNLYASLGRPRRQVTEQDMRQAIDAVLAGKPVSNPQTTAFGCSIVSPDILEGK